MVPDAILGLVGEIRMAGTENFPQFFVRRGIDIIVPDQEGKGRSRSLPFKYSRENLHPVFLLAGA
jgi:hypothetical protein